MKVAVLVSWRTDTVKGLIYESQSQSGTIQFYNVYCANADFICDRTPPPPGADALTI